MSFYHPSKVFHNNLESYRPSIDTVNRNAAEMLRECTPEMARAIQDKLDQINQRYDTVLHGSRDLGDKWHDTLSQVISVDEAIDGIDDFVLPLVEQLQSPDLMKMDINELNRKLQVCNHRF